MGTDDTSAKEDCILQYISITQELQKGNYAVEVPLGRTDKIGKLGAALHGLAQHLDKRHRELLKLNRIATNINTGLLLDEVLEGVYRDFRDVIPYERIGFSFLENHGKTVRSYWCKSDQGKVFLKNGYAAALKGSSLQTIIETGKPRILNDLLEYIQRKPGSRSTRLILKEGIRSSLTCPLIANGVPIGFVFFSSTTPHAYADAHIEVFLQIAAQLSVIVEKGRLITKQIEHQAEIERKNEELRQLNDLKNTFLGVVAHDLRSPIGSIQMAAHLLADPSLDLSKEQREIITHEIVSQSNYMMALLNDLLDVAHINSGKFTLTPQPIQVLPFLSEIVVRHHQAAQPKGVQVVLERSPAHQSTLKADPMRLRQVFDNLLSNAVKFSPTGSHVRVRAIDATQHWRFEIQDEGPGISPDEQKLLFQEFVRLSARPTSGEKSTGLGLAITRRVVEAHKGNIGVHSEPGRGANFWFTLPSRR
jgi:hypothetical protein